MLGRTAAAWGATVAATGLAAVGQWALIALTGRLAGADQLGVLSWAMAFSTPWLILTSLQLRTVIAGHAPDSNLLKQLLRLRLSTVAATGMVLLIVAAFTVPNAWLPTVLCVVLWAMGTWIGDLLQGWLQVRGRIITAAVCQAARPVGAALVAGLVLFTWPGAGALAAAAAAALVSCVVLLAIETPCTRRLTVVTSAQSAPRSLSGWLMATAPLGIATGVSALAAVLPRFGVMHWHGAADLGAFTAMTVMVTAACQLFGAPAPLIIARLARSIELADQKTTLRWVSGVSAAALGLGLFGWLAAVFVGAQAMSLIFGNDIGARCTALPDMALVAAIELLQFPLGYVLTAGRRYRQQVMPTFAGFITTAVLVWWWVPPMGLRGAAWALAIGGVVRLLGMLPTGVMLVRTQKASVVHIRNQT